MTQTMVQAPTYSSSMRAHIDILLSRRSEWRRFRNQTTRVWFTVMPSLSNPDRVHQLTMSRCDCRGWEIRHYCAHVLSLREAANHDRLDSQPEPLAVAPPPARKTYADIFPACRKPDCSDPPEAGEQDCSDHVLVDAL